MTRWYLFRVTRRLAILLKLLSLPSRNLLVAQSFDAAPATQRLIDHRAAGLRALVELHLQIAHPFLPVCRGEDALFARITQLCRPRSFFAHLPTVLRHDPIEARHASLPGSAIRVWHVVAALLSECAIEQPNCPDALSRIGAYLVEVGHEPREQFQQRVATIQVAECRRAIAAAPRSIEAHEGAPSYWLDAVDATVLRFERAIEDDRHLLPVDTGYHAPDAIWARCAEIVTQYGHLLSWWPAIVAAALRVDLQ